MTGRTNVLVALLHLALLSPNVSAKRSSYLSCISSYSGDYVLLDCYYNGGLPFPTLVWTGPGGLDRSATNTPRFTVNITREQFVDKWDTVYKCKAIYWYSTSYCFVGRGIGSYVGIAFGVLALLILLCVLTIFIWNACLKLSASFSRRQVKNEVAPAISVAGCDNPTYVGESAQEEKTTE